MYVVSSSNLLSSNDAYGAAFTAAITKATAINTLMVESSVSVVPAAKTLCVFEIFSFFFVENLMRLRCLFGEEPFFGQFNFQLNNIQMMSAIYIVKRHLLNEARGIVCELGGVRAQVHVYTTLRSGKCTSQSQSHTHTHTHMAHQPHHVNRSHVLKIWACCNLFVCLLFNSFRSAMTLIYLLTFIHSLIHSFLLFLLDMIWIWKCVYAWDVWVQRGLENGFWIILGNENSVVTDNNLTC